MSLVSDARTLAALAVSRHKGSNHKERLESFYSSQADHYDDFRERLLPGRLDFLRSLPFQEDGVWLDIGAGTGWNTEAVAEAAKKQKKIYLVDLCEPLLEIAKKRISRLKLRNVEVVCADAAQFTAPEKPTLVTLSYSLSMMPNWMTVLRALYRTMARRGVIGVIDFYVSQKHTPTNRTQHSWWTRTGWPVWFAWDNVFLNDAQLPALEDLFSRIELKESTARLPYLPLVRAPYYRFVGRK